MSLSIASLIKLLLLLSILLMILGSTSGSPIFRMRQRLQQDDQADLQVNALGLVFPMVNSKALKTKGTALFVCYI
jgi:hypothetical protein